MLNKFYRNGNLVFEDRKGQRAFEIQDNNPGFLVCCFEAENIVGGEMNQHLRYKMTHEIELDNEKLVGEFIEDMMHKKVGEIKTDQRYNKLKVKESSLKLF